MPAKPWTKEELTKLKAMLERGRSLREITAEFSYRSFDAVENKLTRLRRVNPELRIRTSAPVKKTTVKVDLSETKDAYWKKQYQGLLKKYQTVVQEEAWVERLRADAAEWAPKSYNTAPPLRLPHDREHGKPQSALLLLTDAHVGQHVFPSQTQGFGLYNPRTFLQRLKALELAVRSILTDHTTTAVPELVVALGGDLVDGALNHSAEAAQVETLFDQIFLSGHALAQFLTNLSGLVPKVRVYGVVGNHGRFPHQRKMPTKNRYSSLDSLAYAMAEALTKDSKSIINWNLDEQPAATFKVQNHIFWLLHGDTLRGGDRAMGVPSHAIGRAISSVSQAHNAAAIAAPNYYLAGDKHRPMTLPHTLGEWIFGGSFVGADEYAFTSHFPLVSPSQFFALVHPVYGLSARYTINLKRAVDFGNKLPYEMPARLVDRMFS